MRKVLTDLPSRPLCVINKSFCFFSVPGFAVMTLFTAVPLKIALKLKLTWTSSYDFSHGLHITYRFDVKDLSEIFMKL